jgi:hypothetical protein
MRQNNTHNSKHKAQWYVCWFLGYFFISTSIQEVCYYTVKPVLCLWCLTPLWMTFHLYHGELDLQLSMQSVSETWCAWILLIVRCTQYNIINYVCRRLAAGQWLSSVSSIYKTDRHDINEMSFKVALNTINIIQVWLCNNKLPVNDISFISWRSVL